MSKSRLAFLLLSVALLAPIVSGTLSRAASEAANAKDSLSKHLSVFSEVLSLIRRAYVEETTVEDLLAGALDGSTDALDPMATYVPAAEVERFLEARRLGRQRSGLTVAKERGITFVVAVDPGSPGAEAGLEQGDILAKVNERSTRRMPLWRLQTLLAAEPGSELALEVLRRGQTRDLSLVLGEYALSPPRLEQIEGESVLRIQRFDDADLDALREILTQLVDRGTPRLLIDVRGVAGGAAEAAFAAAGLFAQGRLGGLRARDEATLEFEAMEGPLWRGGTVILIDSGTQGAAEIFTAVMQQLAASRLVGRQSFGHAGRQRLIPLSDGSQLLLTDAFYTGPNGELIDTSLEPDLVVTELDRQLAEQDQSLEELTLERGLELLRSPRDDSVEDVA